LPRIGKHLQVPFQRFVWCVLENRHRIYIKTDLRVNKNKIKNINLVKKKTRVVQVEAVDSNHNLQEITENH